NLDYTQVTDKGIPLLKSLPRLVELRLDTAAVTDAGAALLSGITTLKHLNVYHTLVTEKGHQELKKALPACEIIWDRDSSLPNRRGA
ncbi:MAG: hypothetical protein ACRD44_06175, partial [Bryobacteraceae bacterium]